MSNKSKRRKAQAQAQAQRAAAAPAKPSKQSNVFERLLGVITLKAPIYREIAEDHSATLQAAIIVVVVALIVGAITALGASNATLASVTNAAGVASQPPVKNPVGGAVVMVIDELLIWIVGSFFIAGVARGYFHGSTDTGEILRIFGYTRIFQILLILGVFGSPVAAVVSIAGMALSIIGTVIGVREAASFDTGKAVISALFAIILVSVLVAFVATFVLNPIVTTLLPT